MNLTESSPIISYTSFNGPQRIATGSLQTNALAVKKARESASLDPVLIFDNANGRCIDMDTRGSDAEVLARYADPSIAQAKPGIGDNPLDPVSPKGPGRPKLGVVPREVTLLPRHWEWLATQPGGASVALRKLVEKARLAGGEKDRLRQAHERAYHFMLAMGGDLPGFEEATRALFANDPLRVRDLLAPWPVDLRDHAMHLAFGNQ